MSGRLSTRSVALIGLVLVAFVLCLGYELYGPGVVEAQVTPSQTDTSACPGAHTLQEFTGTGNMETELFEVSTGRFLGSYEFKNVEEGVRLHLFAAVENERGESIDASTPVINPSG